MKYWQPSCKQQINAPFAEGWQYSADNLPEVIEYTL
jgi:hypothetical protein